VSSELFCEPGCDPQLQTLHVSTRVAARFWKDSPGGANCRVELGAIGCPRNTTQVIFFTDDESFIEDEDELDDNLCSVVRSTVVRGEAWVGDWWDTYGDFRIFVCGITAGGDHYSASGMLCVALETYYISHFRVRTASRTAG
jgi:hypothetical protein